MTDPTLMLTLAAGAPASFVLDILIVLSCAAAVTLVLGRIRLGPIPGYLIAGAIIGPSALGFISDEASVDGISQTAIILLMFGIGLQMSRHELRGGMLPVLLIGLLSTLGTIAIGTPVAMLFGLDVRAAAAIAGAMAMSSTAVVLRILSKRGELRQAHGRIAFGTLISQDLLVIGVLAALPAIAPAAPELTEGVAEAAGTDEGGRSMLALLADMMIAIGVIGLTVGAGVLFLPRLLAEAARDASGELLLVLTAAVALGAAYITSAVGLSPELGAFVAGFLLAGTPFRYQLSGMLSPMRDLFMAVFFTAVGLQLDLGAVAEVWWVVPLAVGALMVVKFLTIGISAWMVGAPTSVAGVSALCLAQAGEFSLIVLTAAIPLGFFANYESAPAVAVAVVVVSLIVAPGVIDLSRKLAAGLRRVPSAPWSDSGALTRSRSQKNVQSSAGESEEPTVRSVVIAGYGPVGRALAARCAELGFRLSIIELNPDTVRTQERLGLHVVYGDVTNPAVLSEAGVESASAVLLAFRDDDIMVAACRAIRHLNKDTYIAARTDYLSKALLAKGEGANHVTVSEIATAEMMLNQVVDSLRGFAAPATSASDSDPQARPEA